MSKALKVKDEFRISLHSHCLKILDQIDVQTLSLVTSWSIKKLTKASFFCFKEYVKSSQCAGSKLSLGIWLKSIYNRSKLKGSKLRLLFPSNWLEKLLELWVVCLAKTVIKAAKSIQLGHGKIDALGGKVENPSDAIWAAVLESSVDKLARLGGFCHLMMDTQKLSQRALSFGKAQED